MHGLMMDYQLTLGRLLERAVAQYPTREIVTRRDDGSLHRTTYADTYERVRRLADALSAVGVKPGERVASLCWNHREHLELYFGPAAMGAVLHTLNPRLHADQIVQIANHAEDVIFVVDRSLLHLAEQIRRRLPAVRAFVVVGEADDSIPDWALSYEELVAGGRVFAPLPEPAENDAAAMCFTSGTTGAPKGVVYSHRSLVLHSLMQTGAGTLGFCDRDTVMPVVPMFHANAWGFPYTATLVGAKQVLPGRDVEPAGLLRLMEAERVTVTAAVPTVWFGVLDELESAPDGRDLSSVRLIKCGGSAAPPSLIAGFERHGLHVLHGWGMTEMSPLGAVAHLKPGMEAWSDDERLGVRAAQGTAVPLVEMKILDDEDDEVPWDGKSMGELLVRGPWVAGGYFRNEEATEEALTEDGWFRTGDIVTIDPDGYVRIVDRAKDLVKSGGEWISSVEIESALMAHPAVREAAVIAVPHPKWLERPLAVVALHEGLVVEASELNEFLSAQFVSWWLPDEILFVDDIPKTSVGKYRKSLLRDRYAKRGHGD